MAMTLDGHDLVFTVDDAEALVPGVATGELDVPMLAVPIGEHLR